MLILAKSGKINLMDTLVLYGEDNVSSDQFYLDYRRNFTQTEEINPLTRQTLETRIQNLGFFSEPKLFVFKNVFLNQVRAGKVSAKLNDLLLLLVKLAPSQNLLFFDDDANKVKYYKQYFPKATYKEFKISPYLFYFLDSFKPQNLKKCYDFWQKSKLKNAPELVFHMLKRRLRELISVTNHSLKGNYQPWQLGKLKAQAVVWEPKKLLTVYKALYNYEKGLKSGTNPLNIEQVLEIVLTLYL